MDTLTIVGCQFGDEGKGKIIDYLSCNYDLSVRFNGGENAGHTVVTDGNTIKYHLVPAGFLRARTSVIANGVVINLRKLNEEIDFLSRFRGSFELKISNLAHIVTDLHIERDRYLESLRGKGSIGTTLRGIGPAYESKFGRYGIRLEDFKDPKVLEEKLGFLSYIYNIPKKQGMVEDLIHYYEKISTFITDTSEYLREEIDEGSSALFETAQGTFIDVEFGISFCDFFSYNNRRCNRWNRPFTQVFWQVPWSSKSLYHKSWRRLFSDRDRRGRCRKIEKTWK